MCVLDSGERETMKACYHGAIGALALGAFGYNLLALWRRRQTHLAFNALVYGVLVLLETRQVQHHARRT